MLTRCPMKMMAFASQSETAVLDSTISKTAETILALILCSILCSMYLYVHSMYNLEVI